MVKGEHEKTFQEIQKKQKVWYKTIEMNLDVSVIAIIIN